MKLFTVFLFVLMLVSCKKEATSWDTDWVVPIVNDTLSLKNLQNDSTFFVNGNSFYEVDLTRTLLNIGINEIVAIPDTFIEQTELEGLRLFYKQCIKGDRSDNVKGIDGLGEKKATDLLSNCTTELEMFNRVRDLYGNDEEFIMNASVLWILRSLDDNWKDRFDALIQE